MVNHYRLKYIFEIFCLSFLFYSNFSGTKLLFLFCTKEYTHCVLKSGDLKALKNTALAFKSSYRGIIIGTGIILLTEDTFWFSHNFP